MNSNSLAIRSALIVAGIYAVLGFAWIAMSDLMLASMTEQPREAMIWQTYKGWAYVGLTALLGFLLIYSSEKRLRTQADRLQDEIDNRLQLERRQRMIMNELDHRVKNNLATVLSLSALSQSHATDFEAFQQKLKGRIQTMARSHEQLVQNNWQQVDLESLIQAVIEPDLEGDLEIEGPSLALSPRTASTLAMILNEIHHNLCTATAENQPCDLKFQ